MSDNCKNCTAVKALVDWRDNIKKNIDQLLASIVIDGGNCPSEYGFTDHKGKCTNVDCLDCWREAIYGNERG